jgi:hypothetical protein
MVFDPGALILVLATEALYLRALRVLRARGVAVPRPQIAAWHAGIALWVIGFFSPIHTLGEELLSGHMAQHLLIADLAAPLLLVGARNPVLAFLLPRPALVTLARSPRLRGAFRVLRRPLVAVPVYALVLYAWHFSIFFEAAVRYPVVHARGGRPAGRGRDDGDRRRADHGLRAVLLLLALGVRRRARGTPRGGAHSTVSVPSMPASRWPSTEQ